METCEICSGELIFIGQLGKKAWYRCRCCGSQESREEENPLCQEETHVDSN